jgi:hypothetical protein
MEWANAALDNLTHLMSMFHSEEVLQEVTDYWMYQHIQSQLIKMAECLDGDVK